MELERAKAHRRLEEEIEQRRAMEQELAAAKIAAETANQAKSAFISHCASWHLLECLGGVLQIEWLYSSAEPRPPVAATDLGAFRLKQELAGELYHLAMLGDVSGLVERANATLQENPHAEPFCRELLALANQYDTGAIRRMLSAQTR